MKKYISVLAIIFIISLAACSNQTISSTPTGNESNIQSNSITTLDKGIWPVNEYTEGLPIPPGTVAWATLDTEHENCNVNLTGISDDDYSEYMEVLNQEGFSVIENVSEEIEEGNYVSIGTLLSNEDKWLSISYIPDSLTILETKNPEKSRQKAAGCRNTQEVIYTQPLFITPFYLLKGYRSDRLDINIPVIPKAARRDGFTR